MGQEESRRRPPDFICEEQGIVQPRQVADEIREFKNCRMTVVRMECPTCGTKMFRIGKS